MWRQAAALRGPAANRLAHAPPVGWWRTKTQVWGHRRGAGVPYDLTPAFLDELLNKQRIDYVIHGDDPCILPGAPPSHPPPPAATHGRPQGTLHVHVHRS